MAAWYLRYIPTTPKVVKGGIKAQNSRGGFAKTWWGKQWIDTLESFSIGSRLVRGKSYARSGQVTDLVITTKGVAAKVQGSRSKPYSVVIQLNAYSKMQQDTLASKLRAKPLYIAQLLSSEMPESMEQVCKTIKIPLFPVKYNDLQSTCSCPDYSNPCKHIAAVIYLIAEALDRDPFLLFTLRGMDKNALLKSISDKHRVQAAIPGGDKPIAPPEPLPANHTAFWGSAATSEDLIIHALPKVHASMIKRLGPIPFWRSSNNLISTMEKAYSKASLSAENLIRNPGDETKSAS